MASGRKTTLFACQVHARRITEEHAQHASYTARARQAEAVPCLQRLPLLLSQLKLIPHAVRLGLVCCHVARTQLFKVMPLALELTGEEVRVLQGHSIHLAGVCCLRGLSALQTSESSVH